MISSIKTAFAALSLSAAALAGAQQIQVQVDGIAVAFPNAQPQYVHGRVLVPLRGVFEQMGATVGWNQSTRTVSATKQQTNIDLRIGDPVATVNGSAMNLDVPAMIINGSTMVPIRFVSEALGAQVGWLEAQRLVSITTGAYDGIPGLVQRPVNYNYGEVRQTPQNLRRVVMQSGGVIPVTLDQTLSSLDNHKGDTFTATVDSGQSDTYGDLPSGTQIKGHVAAVHAMSNGRPALLDLAFDRMMFPNGQTVAINGTLTSLDNQHVVRNADGTMNARNSSNAKDQRMVYAGYGAGAGLLVGILQKKPIEGAILGGVLGYIVGQVQHDQKQKVSDITLSSGTQMGVRIDKDVAVNWR